MDASRSCNDVARLCVGISPGACMSMSKPCISWRGRSWAKVRSKPSALPKDQLLMEGELLRQDAMLLEARADYYERQVSLLGVASGSGKRQRNMFSKGLRQRLRNASETTQ